MHAFFVLDIPTLKQTRSISRASYAVSPLMRQNALRLAIISALGMCGGFAAVGPARAQNCGGADTISGDYYDYYASVCTADDGDKDDSRGAFINPTSVTSSATISQDASLSQTGVFPLGVNGLFLVQAKAGDGYDDGDGGDATSVTVSNSGTVHLTGTNNGGGYGSLISAYNAGGNGDATNSNNDTDGGWGGQGGDVTVTNSGTLTLDGTVGTNNGAMYGIIAEGIGGNGGAQNNSDSGLGDQNGGGGGVGGNVTVTNTGTISLGSASSRLQGDAQGAAIYANSTAGSGGQHNGNAGTALVVTVTHGSGAVINNYWNSSGSGNVFGILASASGGVGMDVANDTSDPGGAGGDGGVASIDSSGTVVLDVTGGFTGDGAAIAARSLGNKGGTGPDKDETGGSGGDANGAYITLAHSASVTTNGHALIGALGQSIGGQGGDGGDGTALAGQGGGGGFGGNAGEVILEMYRQTAITTSGDFASGALMQSIGGGGGTGSDFVAVLGGQGGNGGNGGNAELVSILTAGSITTSGDHAYGLAGQSIAGSGGAGGADTSSLVSLGGAGAGGGTAGEVKVRNSGSITTAGYNSHGIIAQSIGGGGGASGSATGVLSVGGNSAEGATGSDGGDVIINNRGVDKTDGAITTTGNAAVGILAQSIGGGGGSGGDSKGVVGVGGAGGGGGSGASVTLGDLGKIETSGQFSPGVLAQSIGGGGGNGGDTFTASAGVSVAIGGSASGGGNGGAVCLSNHSGCDDGSATYAASNIVTHGDYAPGIIAQSIGGGGGTGGSVNNVSFASVLALQLGGAGGVGGNAAETKVGYSNLNINTDGAHAIGVLAQSIGGGGGNGGDSSYADATVGVNAALVLGGSGNSGGEGNSAIVNLSGSHIATGMAYQSPDVDPATYAPNDAFGVLAQTIGGGGGNGGSVTASDLVLAVPTGEGSSVALNFQAAMGGNGGAGGDACPAGDSDCVTEIVLDNGSTVGTLGDGSHGIVAQSIGGGGGNGGDSSVMGATLGDGDSISVTAGMALGGQGTGGGNGGAVNISLGDSGSAAIQTYGHFANGVLAQSIGGGGGNGGVGSSNAFSNGGATNVDLTMSLGGTGGAGGTGGSVNVATGSTTTIATVGSGSRGIVAQSIGGGGGASQGGTIGLSAGHLGGGDDDGDGDGGDEGGTSGRLTLTLGAAGGSGAEGGTVTASLAGAISTQGGGADAVLLQSIGGGGGLGGSIGADASATPIMERLGLSDDGADDETGSDEGSSYSFNVAVGGGGGTGGHGGDIDLTFAGNIQTTGDWADGIVAQTIGGGGGTGGSSSASGSQATANVTIGVGGSGGAAGDGGDINVMFNDDLPGNNVATAGYASYGVLLQTIGGGGGQGGDGSDKASGDLTIGGADGGNGGGGGTGGTIQVQDGSWLNVTTLGDDAPALAAQSIGGGGGIGGAGNSDASSDDDSDDTSDSDSDSSRAFTVSVGGNGGVAGGGGHVDVTQGIAATTSGDRAHGVLIQSIGGGGGVGGAGSINNLTSVVLGGRGGAGGDGGQIDFTLTDTSHITTGGDGAYGIVAQSIGGGGGIAGDVSRGVSRDANGWTATDEGGNGNGGVVNVTSAAHIQTYGDNAHGIVAQSIGGGGGLGGDSSGGYAGSTGSASSTGVGQDVNVTTSGDITTYGSGSTGIFAQSEGPQGSGVVTVNVNGVVTGGTGSEGSAVWISGDNANYLNVSSTGKVVAGDGGNAVSHDGVSVQQSNATSLVSGAAASTLMIRNAGVIDGDIKCHNGGGIACDVKNEATGTLTGASIYQAHIDNAGLVDIGSASAFDTLTVAGNFTQQSGGILQANVDFAGMRASRLEVQGDAQLNGQVNVLAHTLLPEKTVTVAALHGDIQGALQAKDSPIIDYDATLHGNEIQVRAASADFAAPSMQLSDNQRAVASHVQNTWNSGGTTALSPLYAALDNASRAGAGTYSDQLADLSPGVAVAPAAQMQASMARFTDAIMSCPVFDGADAMTGEQDCMWGQVSSARTNQDGSGGVSGFSYDAVTYQFGGQRQISPGWFLGGSAAYENTHIRGDDGRVGGKGDSGYAGLVLKRETGPWTFSAALGGGYGQYDIERSIRIPGLQSGANADVDVYSAGLRLRVARTFAADQFYLKPYVDLDAFYTRMPGYSESRNAAHLDVESSDQFVVGLSPTLEFGGKVPLTNGAIMRPYMYAGVSLLSDDEYTVKAKLQGAQAGTGSFDSSLPMDDVIGRIGAGIQVSNAGGVDFRLEYDGQFSSHVQSHRGSVKLMVPF